MLPQKISIKKDWWKKTFNPIFFTSYNTDISNENTNKEVNFIISNLKLQKGNSILDLGCGIGRHSINLAKKGFKVTGVDYPNSLLRKARRKAKNLNLKVNFIKGDMRNLNLKTSYDVILCLYTSLGYFTYEENQKTINEISKILKPNGKILIDMYDYAKVYDKFLSKKVSDKQNTIKIVSNYLRGDLPIHDIQTFDLNSHVEHTKRYFNIKGENYFYELYLTFYDLHQYKIFFENAGLVMKRLWGEFDGSPRSSQTTRTIMLIQKKSADNDNYLISMIEKFKLILVSFLHNK